MTGGKVVLLEPENPENTGLAARLCANYCYDLRLVSPCFNISEARETASSYQEKLREAVIFDSLDEAVEDVDFLVGTKPGKGVEVSDFSASQDVSVLVGPESSGLSNSDLGYCDAVVCIDTPGEDSLNQATALSVFLDRLKSAEGKVLDSGRKQEISRRIDSRILEELVFRGCPSEDEADRLLEDL